MPIIKQITRNMSYFSLHDFYRKQAFAVGQNFGPEKINIQKCLANGKMFN
jgi:hypothetical protein